MKWIVIYESKFPNKGKLECKCDKCGHIKFAEYRDLAFGKTEKYIMPNYCENCGDKKSNTIIYPTD